jgi:hypothetical protein
VDGINEVLLGAFVARVQAGLMDVEQVPIPYQELVLSQIEGGDSESGESEVS